MVTFTSLKQYDKLHNWVSIPVYTFIKYLLSNKVLIKIEGFILLDFQIFENVWCIVANYKKNVAVVKNRGTVILTS